MIFFFLLFYLSIIAITAIYKLFCAGLNIEVDRILEIACIITDGYLTKTVEVLNSM